MSAAQMTVLLVCAWLAVGSFSGWMVCAGNLRRERDRSGSFEQEVEDAETVAQQRLERVEELERWLEEETLRRNTDESLGDDGRELLGRRFFDVIAGSDADIHLRMWTGEMPAEACLLAPTR